MLVQKIAVIGNAGGGKTVLSRSLQRRYHLPLTHVDAIQFIAGMKIRPYQESIEIISKIQNEHTWIIDGYGPLDILEKRLQLADQILFIDFPVWRHFWWCTKRQIKSIWSKRDELPEGSNEATYKHSLKLYKTIWSAHKKMRPELIRILNRENLKQKVSTVHNMSQWNEIFKNGLR